MEIVGKIHSLESFGTVDGPGIRFVIFMQGCPLRCLYCHNPDTWDTKVTPKYSMTPSGLLAEVVRYKNFIAKGGVTVTGGEPLLQTAFLKEFFSLCRKEGLHTALDTSGCILNDDVKELLENTELVLLDLKAISSELHQRLTGMKNDKTLRFLSYLQDIQKPVWIRHVIVPGYTDDENQLDQMAKFLTLYSTIQKVELLPYHVMGTHKYEQLDMKYQLQGIPPLTEEELTKAKDIFQKYNLPV